MTQTYLTKLATLCLKFFFVYFLTIQTVSSQTLIGKVIGISDGDTLTVLNNQKQIRVRLAEIDTPETGQPYANKAKQNLSKLVFGKTVSVDVIDVDRYGRAVGKVYLDGTYVNAELIRTGSAWVYRKYSKDKSLLVLEEQARDKRLGLWGLNESERIPPWEWRKGGTVSAQNFTKNDITTDTTCGKKKYCRQMSNCIEAKMYLNQCGLTRLDGDGDGLPCESICR